MRAVFGFAHTFIAMHRHSTYNSSGKDYEPTYSARIEHDPAKGSVARFELRRGDVPPFGGGERAEVQGNESDTGGTEGQIRW